MEDEDRLVIKIAWLLAIALAAETTLAGEWIFRKTGSRREDFQAFRGSWQTLPDGFAVSLDGITMMGETSADFLGVHAGGTRTGGCYSWLLPQTNYVIGCQATAEKFTPGFFQVAISNATGERVEEMTVEYLVWYLNDVERASVVKLETGRGIESLREVTACRFLTPAQPVLPAQWENTSRSSVVAFRPALMPGETIRIRWTCDDAGGSGSRDEIGIDDVRVTLFPPKGTVVSIR